MKTFKSIGKILNITAAIGFVVVYNIVTFTYIGLCFFGPVCTTSGICMNIWTYVVPIYLLIDLLVHIFINRKEKIKEQILLLLKQLGISFLIFFELVSLSCMLSIISYSCLIEAKSPDNNCSYIIKDKVFLENDNLTVINIDHSKTESNSVPIQGLLSFCEISWIDNDHFNIFISSSNMGNFYYSYDGPDKLISISEDEYNSHKYINVDKLELD